jgi:hypothetical protein
MKYCTAVSIRRDGGKVITPLNVLSLKPMSIDLTGADEQDWADGEKAPPIRYSELTTDDERTSDAVEQLKEPLMEVLTTHYRYADFPPGEPSPELVRKAGVRFMNRLDSELDSPVEELFESVAAPDTDQSDWMYEYLHRVAQRAVEDTSDSFLGAIYPYIIVTEDGVEYKRKRKTPTSPDSLRDEHDVRQPE